MKRPGEIATSRQCKRQSTGSNRVILLEYMQWSALQWSGSAHQMNLAALPINQSQLVVIKANCSSVRIMESITKHSTANCIIRALWAVKFAGWTRWVHLVVGQANKFTKLLAWRWRIRRKLVQVNGDVFFQTMLVHTNSNHHPCSNVSSNPEIQDQPEASQVIQLQIQRILNIQTASLDGLSFTTHLPQLLLDTKSDPNFNCRASRGSSCKGILQENSRPFLKKKFEIQSQPITYLVGIRERSIHLDSSEWIHSIHFCRFKPTKWVSKLSKFES